MDEPTGWMGVVLRSDTSTVRRSVRWSVTHPHRNPTPSEHHEHRHGWSHTSRTEPTRWTDVERASERERTTTLVTVTHCSIEAGQGGRGRTATRTRFPNEVGTSGCFNSINTHTHALDRSGLARGHQCDPGSTAHIIAGNRNPRRRSIDKGGQRDGVIAQGLTTHHSIHKHIRQTCGGQADGSDGRRWGVVSLSGVQPIW
jgi:hypothetical protein